MHSQEADLFMKVIMMRANINLLDLLGCFITSEGLGGWGGGESGIHYSLKIQLIIHLFKILGYSLK